MKKKRFYKNVKRNQQWTQSEAGREIDFADKYMSGEGIYSDKFDYMRPKVKKKRKRIVPWWEIGSLTYRAQRLMDLRASESHLALQGKAN